MISLQSCPVRGEEVLSQRAAGTQVLLNVADGHYYTLNDVGAQAWDLCNGSRTVSEIASKICEEYDAAPSVIEADLLQLLADLAQENLVADTP